jgi:hypothetical protein
MEDSKSRATKQAKEALQGCTLDASVSSTSSAEAKLEALSSCLLRQAELEMNKTEEEISFQSGIRKDIAERLKLYACDPDELNPRHNETTTLSVHNATWNGKPVQTLFESEYSSVKLFKEFLNPVQCAQIVRLGAKSSQTIPLEARKTDRLVDAIMTKIQSLVSSVLEVRSDYYSLIDPLIEIRLASSGDQECEMQHDGTCKEDSVDRPKQLIVTAQADEIARLFVTCTDDENGIEGGKLFFPKTGTQILPVSGEAVLIEYRDSSGSGKTDKEPFLDEHIVCPVRKGTVVTLEDVYINS